MMSVLRVVVVAAVLIACFAQEDATAAAPGDLDTAFDAAKADLWKLITNKDAQWAVAVVGLIFGYVALTDGKKFFQVLVLLSTAVVTFCMALSQIDTENKVCNTIAAVEVGLFMGFAAKKGWECTQLLLGLAIGTYMFHNVQALALSIPQVADLAHHSVWITALCTAMVLLGCWMVSEKHGAGRVMGIVTPLFGSSVVVAAIGYLAMLAFVGDGSAKVPSVVEFWNMIANPLHSQAVGIFAATDTALIVGSHRLEIDQVLSIFFTIVIFVASVKYQLKVDAEERTPTALKAPLLTELPISDETPKAP